MTVAELARDREDAAAALEAAIVALGVALARYRQATAQLDERGGGDLDRYLEVPLILHLTHAGLGPWLDRKLQGTPAPLRTFCAEQHRRAGLTARESIE